MKRESSSSNKSSASADSHPPKPTGIGFGALARKITRRTTDLLAIAIVAVGLLAVSGKLVDWWNTDPAETTPAVTPQTPKPIWGGNGAPVSIRAGSQKSTLNRRVVKGTEDEAVDLLLAEARRLAALNQPPRRALDDRERRLLAQLASQQPIEQQGSWRIYRLDFPTVFVIAVRKFRREDSKSDFQNRVVYWSIAQPTADGTWTLFSLHSLPEVNSAEEEIPLPLGSRRIMALTDEDGYGTIVLSGSNSINDALGHFESLIEKRKWKRISETEYSERGWSIRFITADERPRIVDVQLRARSDSPWSGLITIQPR